MSKSLYPDSAEVEPAALGGERAARHAVVLHQRRPREQRAAGFGLDLVRVQNPEQRGPLGVADLQPQMCYYYQ